MSNPEVVKPAGLELMRVPFPDNLINKLPKGTKAQNQCPDSEKINCKVCGGWHHPRIAHLDYVGHAAITQRLLECDPAWSWEPLAIDGKGLPAYDEIGGLWIKLTVCGVTRMGYGDAAGKTGSNAIKEIIGDAIRNAAMRFGAALELWHKGELTSTTAETDSGETMLDVVEELCLKVEELKTDGTCLAFWKTHQEALKDTPPLYKKFKAAVEARRLALRGDAA
jgi:hypothetical protein